ncbi:MAG: hypothetical protein AAF495_19425 [Pseudomonadota bacterium]
MLGRALLFLALLACAGAAQAGPSKIEAKAYGKVPTSGPIRVETLQQGALADWVAEHFKKDLAAKGYTIDDQAPLYLRFQTTIRKNTHEHGVLELDWGDGLGYDDRFELGPRYGAPLIVPAEEADWRVGDMVYVLHAEIAEAGQAPLWVGELHREGQFNDHLKIEVRITRQLVDTIGQTLMREQQ